MSFSGAPGQRSRKPGTRHRDQARHPKEPPMRTLISTAFISLDGVVEAPGGEPGYRNSGWTFKDVEFLP
ncbi:dihydrofolate reductase family protein, partial [Streptomyces sp. NPDC002671]